MFNYHFQAESTIKDSNTQDMWYDKIFYFSVGHKIYFYLTNGIIILCSLRSVALLSSSLIMRWPEINSKVLIYSISNFTNWMNSILYFCAKKTPKNPLSDSMLLGKKFLWGNLWQIKDLQESFDEAFQTTCQSSL